MLYLGIVYVVGALAAPAIYRIARRRTFYILALIPFVSFIWTILQFATVRHQPRVWSYTWIPQLQFDLVFRLDMLSWLMLMVINGAGTLIMIYCAEYFPKQAPGLGRFSGFFLGFALSMNGLVLSDHMLVLYLFWEMTALFSFLLIGHHFTYPNARGSARQAFLVTTFGSLAMFGGFFVLQYVTGTSFIVSDFIKAVINGGVDTTDPVFITALVLILLGAISKSAMLPFHFWLPAAMAAPTPVSAFLHAASMVKAGIYLVLRLGPVIALTPGQWWISALGAATMIVGAYRALRQRDLKLVLAYGTVSQLGFMMALAGWATPVTKLACVSVLIAHATFKSALFLTTGSVEKLSGTRNLTELSGFGKRHPYLAVGAGLACISMAGIPISMGYVAKEVAIDALATSDGALLLVALIIGSIMTVAYSCRYWWGAFATKSAFGHQRRDSVDTVREGDEKPNKVFIVGIPVTLAAITIILGWIPSVVERAAVPVALEGYQLDATPQGLHLGWWSGPGAALITAVIIGCGVIMFVLRQRIWRFQRRVACPDRFSAGHIYNIIIRLTEAGAGRLVAFIQRGSLPYDLVVILMTALVAVGAAGWYGKVEIPSSIHLADYMLQVELAIIITVAAIMTVRAARRLTAAITLGVVGASIAALFFTFGGPDLALTQLVVEAVSLVIFVLVFRRLPAFFSQRPMKGPKFFRAVLATVVGVGVVLLGLISTSARQHLPVSTLLPQEVKEFGHGENIVNVILVDVRAWDTVGELTVLLVAALGVTSLVYVRAISAHLKTTRVERRRRLAQRVKAETRHVEQLRAQRLHKAAEDPTSKHAHSWLAGAGALPFEQRSLIMEVSTRVLFHTLMLVSIWLLLIGHNNPGGGFVAGMTAGIALAIRYIAGGRFELFAAAPFKPGYVLGIGIFIAALSGGIPVLAGQAPFQTIPINIDFGFAGQLHFTTAIFLDIGVYIVVMGVVLDILASLGSEVDRHHEAELRTTKSPSRTTTPKTPTKEAHA